MAFTAATFGLLAQGANGFHIWNYRTADAKATVDSSGYFNSFAEQINVGDMIIAFCGYGGTLECGFFFVSSNTGTVVDVNDMVAPSTTDTD